MKLNKLSYYAATKMLNCSLHGQKGVTAALNPCYNKSQQNYFKLSEQLNKELRRRLHHLKNTKEYNS